MIEIYEKVILWAEVVLLSTPIRWSNASSLYYQMIQRMNCVQNLIITHDNYLICDKVATFIIVGGQDNVRHVAFSDVREQDDDKLGFEVTLQNLKSEIDKNQQVHVLLSAFTATFNSIIMGQFDQIQKVSSFIEFGPLVKAAKGEMVPTNQLKKGVINAIDILVSSDPTDRSASVLNTTKLFLQEDIQKSDIQGSGDIA